MDVRLTFGGIVLSLLGLVGCAPGADFERMRDQQRPGPLAIPAGTVPYGERDAPPATTGQLVARGRRQFQITCALCHGDDASGRSLMAANVPGNPPPPLVAGHAAGMSDGEMFGVISRGRNRMPAFAWALPADDRWALVAYVRSLQTSNREAR